MWRYAAANARFAALRESCRPSSPRNNEAFCFITTMRARRAAAPSRLTRPIRRRNCFDQDVLRRFEAARERVRNARFAQHRRDGAE